MTRGPLLDAAEKKQSLSAVRGQQLVVRTDRARWQQAAITSGILLSGGGHVHPDSCSRPDGGGCQTLAVPMGPGVGYTGILPVRLSCSLSVNPLRVQVAARRGPGRGGGGEPRQHSCLYIAPSSSRAITKGKKAPHATPPPDSIRP